MTQTRGTPLGSLVLEEKVATTARGEIYLGRQPALDRFVTVRKLPFDLMAGSGVVERFLREARLGARVIHPNVVQVYDCFALRGEYYMVQEHVDGTDLAALCTAPKGVPRRVSLAIACEVARGIAALHARRVVHCSLAPDRVVISRWGEVKLIGLGEAREIDEDAPPSLVTPGAFNAPEVAEGVSIDTRADVYSLGAILHDLITGSPPGEQVARLGLDAGAAGLIRRCLAASPTDRPTVREVIAKLEGSLRSASSEECRSDIAAWLWESRRVRGHEEAAADDELLAGPPRESLWQRLRATPLRLPSLPDLPGLRMPRLPQLDLARVRELRQHLHRDRIPTFEQLVERLVPDRLRLPAALGGGIVAGTLIFLLLGEGPPETQQASNGTPSVAAGPSAAHAGAVSFVVYPWAEISIDEGPSFFTPRAAPVELEPGRYEVAMAHPRFGIVHRTIEVAPGKEHVVRHVFDQVGTP